MHARILRTGGGLLLPLHTPYEWEQLFEHLGHWARRHGEARLELRTAGCVVRPAPDPAAVCAECAAPLADLAYTLAWRQLCVGCAKRQLQSAVPGADALAAARAPASRVAG